MKYSIAISFLIFCISFYFVISNSYAHLDHTPHYNGGSVRDGMGEYYPYMALDPEYAKPNELTQIIFSVQDYNNNDVYNIETMVEIYDALTNERVGAFPWTKRTVGDFYQHFVFPKAGNYQIVLSVADKEGQVNHNKIDPPRTILGGLNNCNCERAVFTVSVTQNWGDIRNSLFAIAIVSPITALGVVLAQNYRKNRRSSKTKNDDLIKYSILLLALAGGLVHLAVFPEHGSIHIYYVIFLLVASCIQIGYGIFYVMLTISSTSPNQQTSINKSIGVGNNHDNILNHANLLYKKTLILNMVGLVGTFILLGLYFYSIILPPPLSPTGQPESVDIGGILAKSMEFLLVGGIIYLMLWERKKYKRVAIQTKNNNS